MRRKVELMPLARNAASGGPIPRIANWMAIPRPVPATAIPLRLGTLTFGCGGGRGGLTAVWVWLPRCCDILGNADAVCVFEEADTVRPAEAVVPALVESVAKRPEANGVGFKLVVNFVIVGVSVPPCRATVVTDKRETLCERVRRITVDVCERVVD
jgi:hypothetical protein